MADQYGALYLPGDVVSGADRNVFIHLGLEQVITLNRVGSAPNLGNTGPYTWWFTRFSLEGDYISTTALTSVLGISGNNASYANCGTQQGDYIYVWTYGQTGTLANSPTAGSSRISKISMVTGLEVAACQPDDDISASSFDAVTITRFTIGATNYLFLMENPPIHTDNICIINADAMTIVDTDNFGVATAFNQAVVAGNSPDANSRDLYAIYYDNATDDIHVRKINWSTVGGFTYTAIGTLTGSDFLAAWDSLWSVEGAVWDPVDSTIIALVTGEHSVNYDWETGAYYHTLMAKLDPADASVQWTHSLRAFSWGNDLFANPIARNDLSGGTWMIVDFYGFVEINTTTGTVIREKWNAWNLQDISAISIWSPSVRHLVSLHYRWDELELSFVATLDTTTPSRWKLPPGGFCIFGGWHDPLEQYFYIVRETHDYEGYELVKISTATGDPIQHMVIGYDAANPFPGMPEIFDQESELIGSPTGDRLWQWTSDYIGGSSYNIGILEFDKATLELVDSHQLAWPYTGGSLAGDSGGGGTAASYDGRFITRLGGGLGQLTNASTMMSLYDSVTGGFALIEFWDYAAFAADNYIVNRGHFFDLDGFLYVVAQPTNGVNNIQQGVCAIFKFSVTGGTPPTVTYIEHHDIAADDSISYPSAQATRCLGASYNIETPTVVHIFFSKPGTLPVVRLDLTTWESVEIAPYFPRDFSFADYFNATHNSWQPSGNFYMNFDGVESLYILDVTTGLITTYNIPDEWEQGWAAGVGPLEDWSTTFRYYDPIAGTAGGSGATYTEDAIDAAADQWLLFAIIEPCPPCEVDTTPCGDTVEPACAAEWPFSELQPATVGVFWVAANIGGGQAMFGAHEETKPTANGFWRFTYGAIPIHGNAQIRRWRELEALLEGSGGVICLHAYDGKRAPWLTIGGAITASAVGAFAVGSTSGSIKVTSGGALLPGMFFSYQDRLYRLKTVGTPSGSPLVYPVSIVPNIRAAIPNDGALEFRRPTCRARLAEDGGMSLPLHLLQHASPSVDFDEDI